MRMLVEPLTSFVGPETDFTGTPTTNHAVRLHLRWTGQIFTPLDMCSRPDLRLGAAG